MRIRWFHYSNVEEVLCYVIFECSLFSLNVRSPPEVFFEKGVLNTFGSILGKHLRWRPF